MKNISVIFDIGSSKIRIVAVKNSNDESKILYYNEVAYEGFYDGEFFESEELQTYFENLYAGLKNIIKNVPSVCFVGLPNEFLYLECKKITKKFSSPTKLSNLEILDLYKVDDKRLIDNYELISFSAMRYNIDGKDCIRPLNLIAKTIQLEASFIYAKSHIVTLIKNIFKNVGFEKVEFLCTTLGIGFLKDLSIKPKIIVDVGHLTTNVAVIKGEGAMLLSGFSLGAGHITEEIMDKCKLNYEQAELIKKKVLLTLSENSDECYIIQTPTHNFSCGISLVNKIVLEVLENISNILSELLVDFDEIDINLVGDGISKFKDIDKVLSSILNRKVKILNIDKAIYKAYPASICGLIELVKDIV